MTKQDIKKKKMFYTWDEVNKVINNPNDLTEKDLEGLIEFIIGRGVEVKINKDGISMSWEEATKNILLLIKNLKFRFVKQAKEKK